MGQCDLILLHAPNFDGTKGLSVHIRTKIRHAYSYIESAAIKIGSDVLEVGSFGDYFLNGVNGAKHQQQIGHISGFPILHSQPQKNLYQFQILITEKGEESINIKVYKDMVSVTISHAEKQRFRGTLGLIGEFGSGRLMGRDGVTVMGESDPDKLAAEWQVRDDEPILFQTIQAPQHPQECQLPTPTKQKKTNRIGESTAKNRAAKTACQKAGTRNMIGCIHDVMVTGDLGLAAATAF